MLLAPTVVLAQQPVAATIVTNPVPVSEKAATPLSGCATLSSVVANGSGLGCNTFGYSVVTIQAICTACGGGTTINFEGDTLTDNNYVAITATQFGTNNKATSTTTAGVTIWTAVITGLSEIRARVSAYSAGTITVTVVANPLPGLTDIVNANIIGTVPVSGTFWQATQPISAASLPLPTGAATETTLGTRFADATFTGRMPAGASPANGESNTSTSLSRVGGYNFIFNGTTWDRWTGAVTQGGSNWTINHVLENGVAIASPDANSYILGASAATATQNAGLSTCYLTSAATTNATNCKASAGNLYEIHVTNTTTTNYFLRLYNLAAAPTCSSATGFIETVPALGASANGGINGRMSYPQAFSTGIGFCLTGGGSSTDNTNAATGVYITILYK